MLRALFFLWIPLMFSLNSFGQNNITGNNTPLYIDILITPNKTVNVNNHVNILPSNVKEHVENIINQHSIVENENLIYRIYASSSLKLGDIMTIQEKLLNIYPSKYERYIIIDEKESYILDDSEWVKKLNQLNFKRVN